LRSRCAAAAVPHAFPAIAAAHRSRGHRARRTLGVAITAEGVETSEQLAVLRNAGCADVQGYFFGRPIPGAEIAGRLAASNAKVAAA
jgi:EAL domain-containing protein (putative c-di-GMP-specific phosphodiesterase class I)